MKRPFTVLLAVAVCATLVAGVPRIAVADAPSLAVLSFSSEGLDNTSWYDTTFKPGDALADLVADNLVNKSAFTVVDRAHLGQVLQEHQLAASGDVSPATAVQAGRLIGAKFLIVGRIVQFQKVGSNGADVGNVVGHMFGAGNVSSSKVNINVSVHVIDATSGRIVQAFNMEDSHSGTSFGVAGFGSTGYGGYQSQQFLSSTMGRLINEEASKIAAAVDPAKLVAGPAAPQVAGKVVALSDADIILNVGSAQGVTVGQFFDVMKVVSIKDPDTGKIITSRVPKGKVQVTSVDANSSVAHKIGPGTITVGSAVSAE